MTNIQILSWYAHIRPGSGNPPLYCNSAMELILIILIICSHGDVDVQMLLPFIFEQLLRLYLPVHACTSISVYL